MKEVSIKIDELLSSLESKIKIADEINASLIKKKKDAESLEADLKKRINEIEKMEKVYEKYKNFDFEVNKFAQDKKDYASELNNITQQEKELMKLIKEEKEESAKAKSEQKLLSQKIIALKEREAIFDKKKKELQGLINGNAIKDMLK